VGEADEVEDEGWVGGCISLASCIAGNNGRSVSKSDIDKQKLY
jgi:hypothetical protein